ncbi:MAG: hypothetical protein JSW49_07915 [candidate division WOR-3 bacterium]|nr:MAG: hypothetical protein JSW49_07915 [candidate division WOR-3 bacterium]
MRKMIPTASLEILISEVKSKILSQIVSEIDGRFSRCHFIGCSNMVNLQVSDAS